MAINYVDYKIVDLQLSSQGIYLKVRIYGGDITTEPEQDAEGNTQQVTRYRRQQMLLEKEYNLSVQDVTNLTSRWINKKLKAEAQSRGKQVISEQDSTSV